MMQVKRTWQQAFTATTQQIVKLLNLSKCRAIFTIHSAIHMFFGDFMQCKWCVFTWQLTSHFLSDLPPMQALLLQQSPAQGVGDNFRSMAASFASTNVLSSHFYLSTWEWSQQVQSVFCCVYKIIEGQKKKNTTKLRLENSCLVDVKESPQ
jgi:hypothetical protein